MSEDQLQPQDTLDDRGVADVLDEGISPPEKLRGATAKGVTVRGELEGESIEERLPQEEPDIDAGMPSEEDLAEPGAEEPYSEEDPSDPAQVGDERSGRLVAPDEGLGEDTEADLIARDVGIDGAAASAEEAAMHVVDPDEV